MFFKFNDLVKKIRLRGFNAETLQYSETKLTVPWSFLQLRHFCNVKFFPFSTTFYMNGRSHTCFIHFVTTFFEWMRMFCGSSVERFIRRIRCISPYKERLDRLTLLRFIAEEWKKKTWKHLIIYCGILWLKPKICTIYALKHSLIDMDL